jgi:hypothetical protein
VRQVSSNRATKPHSRSESHKHKTLIKRPIPDFKEIASDDRADGADSSAAHTRNKPCSRK